MSGLSDEDFNVFTDKLQEVNQIVDIARLYYKKKLDQKEISIKTGLNQTRISRILKEAEKRFLKIEIDPKYDFDFDFGLGIDLETKLKEKFECLDEVIISYVSDDNEKDLMGVLGREAAEYFLTHVQHKDTIGLSCGRFLNALVNSLDKVMKEKKILPPERCEVFALVHPCIDKIVNNTPASLVSSIVRQLPGSSGHAYQFPFPEECDKEYSIMKYKKHPYISKMLKDMENLNWYFIGIGGITKTSVNFEGMGSQFISDLSRLYRPDEINDLIDRLDIAGECAHQPFDFKGNLLFDHRELKKVNERLIYLPIKILQDHVNNKSDKKVIAISGGKSKHKAIYTALKAGFFSTLITDSLTALNLIKRDEEGVF